MSNEKCIIATESAKEHILKIKESKKRENALNVGSFNVIHHSIKVNLEYTRASLKSISSPCTPEVFSHPHREHFSTS